MWELDCEVSWALKNWCFWAVILEKTLESPLDCKEIQPVYPKADQSWVFIGRTDAEAETLILRPSDAKNWLTGKDSDAGKDWRQEERGTTEDEMVGWHHRLNGRRLGGLWDLVRDREAWCAAVHGVAKNQTWLSDWTELNYELYQWYNCCCCCSVTRQHPTLCEPKDCITPAPLSSTISWSLLRFMSIELVMLSNHLILCLLLLAFTHS